MPPASDDDQTRVTRLLTQDLASTTGHRHEAIVERHAAERRAFARDADYYIQDVVDNVQQQLHDEFIDTTWPRCPRHHRHPLWLKDGWWCCEQDGIPVARLGQLRTP
jgi:hypothetical protein